jgi:NAD(P)-dependent dehydrogenase (short-subunit alcohol dehydrogenase family)
MGNSDMAGLEGSLLSGKSVLITGGGTGLGKAMAQRFLDLGAKVAICGRREEVLNATKSEFDCTYDGKVRAKVCDIRQPDTVEKMISELFAEEPIDVLVNNAAANFIAQTHELSSRAVDAVLAATLHGTMYCTLACGNRWITSNAPGTVLSILSTSTITGRAFSTPSAMAKSGVLAMTRSLAVEWGPRNIRLVAIAPGSFPTPGATAKLNPATRNLRDPTAFVPLGRHGALSELADMAAFMVSDSAGYMTGEMVVLDGGAHLRSSGVEDLVLWSDDQWAEHRRFVRGG